MKLHDLFPGSFTAEHFEEGPARLTVKAITPIIFEEDGEERQKGKMTFDEVTSYWVFGKEAAGELADQLGDETDEWVGHEIELRKDKTRFKGKMVDCVRASFVIEKRASKPTAVLPAGEDADEDIAELERRLAERKGRAGKAAKVSA